jgi:branched-subunit amino acid ABC-type transport system permease component
MSELALTELALQINLDPQFAWNGLVVGSIFAVAALGLTLIFGVLDFILVCYGEYLALGAYFAWVAYVDFGIPIFVAVMIAMIGVAIISYVLDKTVFQYFRADDRDRVTLLIVSIGIAFILRNVIRIIWGTRSRAFRRQGAGVTESIEVAGVFIQPSQPIIIGASLVMLGVTFLVLRRTDVGIAMRAASDDLDLVRLRGIDTERLVVYVWLIGGAIAGLSGVLLGINAQVRPVMGFFAIILIFGAVIAGGIGSPTGAVGGGYLMGFIREMSVALGIPTNYKIAVAFVVFIGILLWRPDGLFGTSTRDT